MLKLKLIKRSIVMVILFYCQIKKNSRGSICKFCFSSQVAFPLVFRYITINYNYALFSANILHVLSARTLNSLYGYVTHPNRVLINITQFMANSLN